MFKHGNGWKVGVAGFALASISLASQAAVTTYFATQAPKSNLNDPAPPPLTSPITAARSNYNSATASLGTQEFESGLSGFTYTGGAATVLSGTPAVINGNLVNDHTTGRYNLTTGLGPTDYGRWLEASSDFTYRFSSAISSFAFFGTDFGDFDGVFSLEFLSNGNQVYSSLGSTSFNLPGSNQNGGLLFFGAASTVSFDTVVFHITQGTGPIDVLGFDSFLVGTAASGGGGGTVAEPGTLALAGLALLGLGAAARKRRSLSAA